MADWLFTAAAWKLLLAGVFIAWRLGWRDPNRRKRRCPSCWYDLSATAGVQCPECGHRAKGEAGLFRRRVRWRWMLVAVLVAAAADPVSRGARIQRDGLVGAIPRPVVLYTWPSLLRQATRRSELGRFLHSQSLHRRINTELAASPAWWEVGLIRSAAVDVLRSPRNKASERYAEAALLSLGEDMGEGADALVDLFLMDTGRRSGGEPSGSLFYRLPQRGRGQVDRVVQAVQKNPGILVRDPAIVAWLADRTGSVRSILSSIAAAPRGSLTEALRFRVRMWGVTRYRAEEISALAAALYEQAGMPNQGLTEAMANPRPDGAALVSEFRRLLDPQQQQPPSSVLIALCRSGAGMRELVPDIEPWLTHGTPESREIAEIAIAVVRCDPHAIEDRVFAAAAEDLMDTTGTVLRRHAAMWALMSGLWPREVAAPHLARHLSDIHEGVAATEIRAVEYLLSSPKTVREYRDLLIDQFSRRAMLASQFCLHIEQFPEAAAELVPILRGCERRAEGEQRMMFRSARREAQRLATANPTSR